MPCIHGLDEINCPTCRIIRFTLPEQQIKLNSQSRLKAEYPFFQVNPKEEDKFMKELKVAVPDMHKSSINEIITPTLLTNLPNFKNNTLLERLKEIGVSKSNIFALSKRNELASPELTLNKEEK